MKTLIVLLAFTLVTSQAMAQKIVYACQFTESAGLIKEKNIWSVTKFILEKPFFLAEETGQLTKESVSKVLNSPISDIVCKDTLHTDKFNSRHCMDGYGKSLYFLGSTLNGGVSNLFTAGFSSDRPTPDPFKDTLSVSTFTCTKM
jgi:hypothetical protein